LGVRPELPTGTVTFLFTDVEGSTRLLHSLGAEGYAGALAEHRRVIREACASHGGVEVDTQGDAFFFAFPSAPGAVAAASALTEALAEGPIQVRVGLHTGTPLVTDEGYVGDDVHFAARVAAAGHGGQVVLSAATANVGLSGSEPQALSVRDLGEHRLKDIGEAVAIFQLGERSFPPLKTISNTNLPRPASSFVGREAELAEVLGRVERGARLVTLTGPGGSGKTRLALEAAASLVGEFKAGVFWVGLAALRDPALVTETIAQTLGAKDGLAEHVGERELLLLLDNLEHVVEAAPELAALVERCPNLTLLVTSRELLRVRGEVEYPVPPLAEPEAVELFCERAQLERNEEICELCARLDNLPLAVELAAARTKALSPAQILERLSQRLDLQGGRDADPRQQTLRATIEWSYDLLTSEEQALFARLSVFAGGCTLRAAEDVCDAVVDTLQSLVEKSLLRFTDERYWMLETIREFATEQLEEAHDVDLVRPRHAEHFLSLAEAASPNLAGDPEEWLERLEPEHDNMRAALSHLEATGESQLVLRLAGALSEFWILRGHFAEGRRRVEGALAAERRPTTDRAKALVAASGFASFVGDRALERRRAEEGLALHEELGDAGGAALARYALANVATTERDWTKARRLLEECVHEFSALGDDFNALAARRGLAWAHEELGDLERYRALTEENLEQARALGNRRIEARALGALAMLAVAENRLEDAIDLQTRSYQIDRRIGNPVFLAVDLTRFAAICARKERTEIAAGLLSRSEALREETGYSLESWMAEEYEETVAVVRRQLDESALKRAWQQGRTKPIDEAIEEALTSLD
jgi:predicted ATPase/class 3 adenylate cyclase